MASRVLNTAAVTLRMQGMHPEMEREMGGELDALATMVAARMRLLANESRPPGLKQGGEGALRNSINYASPDPLTRDIGPARDYAGAVEEGIAPGGKGLPKFSDPAALEIITWLRRVAFRGSSAPSKGSRAAVNRELELRDRYQGLAWHIRHKGVKAYPFIGRALDQMRPICEVRLQAAGERALRGAGDAA